MSCKCGHEHGNVSKEQFEKVVANFLKTLPSNIDIDEEYIKIQNKESNLSRMQRDTVEAIVEYKKEHFKENN